MKIGDKVYCIRTARNPFDEIFKQNHYYIIDNIIGDNIYVQYEDNYNRILTMGFRGKNHGIIGGWQIFTNHFITTTEQRKLKLEQLNKFLKFNL